MGALQSSVASNQSQDAYLTTSAANLNYLSKVSAQQEYISKTNLNSSLAAQTQGSPYVTSSNFTTSLSNYPTTNILRGYVSSELAPYAKTTAVSSEIANLSNNVSSTYAPLSSLAPYAKTVNVQSELSNLSNNWNTALAVQNQNIKQYVSSEISPFYNKFSSSNLIGTTGSVGGTTLNAGNMNVPGNVQVGGILQVAGQSVNQLVNSGTLTSTPNVVSLGAQQVTTGSLQSSTGTIGQTSFASGNIMVPSHVNAGYLSVKGSGTPGSWSWISNDTGDNQGMQLGYDGSNRGVWNNASTRPFAFYWNGTAQQQLNPDGSVKINGPVINANSTRQMDLNTATPSGQVGASCVVNPAGSKFCFQDDGNFAVYPASAGGRATWTSGTGN